MRSIDWGRPFLSLREAGFRLGDRLVFERTNWTMRRGEEWAIVGPNGGGKSLLADGLRGRLPLVAGELKYHFRVPARLSPEETIGHVAFEDRKADLGNTVVQSRWNSFEEEDALRVSDFLSYERVMEVNPFAIEEDHERERNQFECRRRRATNLVAAASLLDRTLISLSNGERQRVQLAREFCRPLRLLILDEPFASLDVSMRASLHRQLDRLMAARLRVLLITTRLEDLPRQVTHLLWVEDCRVVAVGPRAEVLAARHPGAACGKRRSLSGERAMAGGPQPWKRIPSGLRRPPLVALRDVTVRSGERVILGHIDWTIGPGENWALLGPNGSGKTTLLSLILGDHPQAYGNQVTVFGRSRGSGESIWELKRHIGWVSPELHLHFPGAATCFEVVASGFHDSIGLFAPLTRRQGAATRSWLARFGLRDAADIPLYGISAGLQRMVLLARALVKQPRLLILDEPCQGLDEAHRELFLQTVNRLLLKEGTTAIYVTHREDEIPPAIHRILRLADGRGSLQRR